MYGGMKVTMGDREYVIPSLSTKQAREMWTI